MSKLKITWSEKIPTKTGRYLCRSFTDKVISATCITKKDLEVQKEGNTWLGGVWYSQEYVEEFDE